MRERESSRFLVGLAIVATIIACSSNPDDPLQFRLPTAQPLGSQEVALRQFLHSAGCTERMGPPRAGDIGVFTEDSLPERYSCQGLTGTQIRAAVEGYRQARAAR